jgi:hypothetical protein
MHVHCTPGRETLEPKRRCHGLQHMLRPRVEKSYSTMVLHYLKRFYLWGSLLHRGSTCSTSCMELAGANQVLQLDVGPTRRVDDSLCQRKAACSCRIVSLNAHSSASVEPGCKPLRFQQYHHEANVAPGPIILLPHHFSCSTVCGCHCMPPEVCQTDGQTTTVKRPFFSTFHGVWAQGIDTRDKANAKTSSSSARDCLRASGPEELVDWDSEAFMSTRVQWQTRKRSSCGLM